MKLFLYKFLLLAMVLPSLANAQMSKGKSGTFALTNATIETVTQGSKSGTLLIQDGRIAAIGQDVQIPANAEQIDCSGMTIYPGMIDGGTQIGLAEVGSVDLTIDHNEVGDVTPQMQALTAVNPNSVAIPVTRVNGITTALAAPTGGLFSGTASLINLHGYTPDQMFAGYKAMILRFPSAGRRGRFDRRSDEEVKKQQEKQLKTLNDVWSNAKAYSTIDLAHKAGKGEAPEYYPEMAALAPVTRGEMPLLVEVNAAADIQAALKWIAANEVKAVLTGVAEGWRVAQDIATAKVPVITGPIFRNPSRASDKYDRAYANPGIMSKAGVLVAIRSNESENVRNLPYNAGFAATYGMGKEEALKAVTINPARIFGMEDQIGSLEVGKVANLFVANGDPFETRTQVQHVFINGWQVPMESRHTKLYDEFLERSPGLKK